ncbi:MAG: hypothetical protein Crog3KO_18250 [Crocinitomicaceae bacterium]
MCAYGALDPYKIEVYETETKTNFNLDKRYHRLPSSILVEVADIAYFSTKGTGTNKDYLSVYMRNGREYFSDKTLKHLYQLIPSTIQPNKSNLVLLKSICARNEWTNIYVMRGEERIPFDVYPKYKKEVKERVMMMCTPPQHSEKRPA